MTAHRPAPAPGAPAPTTWPSSTGQATVHSCGAPFGGPLGTPFGARYQVRRKTRWSGREFGHAPRLHIPLLSS